MNEEEEEEEKEEEGSFKANAVNEEEEEEGMDRTRYRDKFSFWAGRTGRVWGGGLKV